MQESPGISYDSGARDLRYVRMQTAWGCPKACEYIDKRAALNT